MVSRILHFSGMMRWTSGMSSRLKSLGYDAEVIFFRDVFKIPFEGLQFLSVKETIVGRGIFANLSSALDVALLRTSYFKNGFPAKYAPEPWSWFSIPIISKYFFSFDLLICYDQYSVISEFALKKVKGIDYVVFTHESVASWRTLFLRLFSGFVERLVFEGATLRCAITQRTANESQNSLKIPFVVVCHWCNPHDNVTTKKQDFFLYDTRWNEIRNPFLILEIARLWRDIKFVVSGSFVNSELFNKFKNAIRKMELTKGVQLKLDISENELSFLCENAIPYFRWPTISKDGFVESGLSFGVYQALEAGCPLIVTKYLSISNILLETDAALLVTHNAHDIASAIFSLAPVRNLVVNMSEAAIRISRKWTWTNRAKALISYYESGQG